MAFSDCSLLSIKQTSLEKCDLPCFPRVVNHRQATFPLPPDLCLPQRISLPPLVSLQEVLSVIMAGVSGETGLSTTP